MSIKEKLERASESDYFTKNAAWYSNMWSRILSRSTNRNFMKIFRRKQRRK